ncbi:MAG: hypothetical protein EOO13_17940 [Chitinophagaceae bacterium]|nr:MAG: hypothetical protein EOO13_17940 [Chitinophagaceae bacterium]
MQLSQNNSRQFAIFYAVCFYMVGAWYVWHGIMLLHLAPVFFLNKADVTGQLFMWTGIQHKIIDSRTFRMLFECIFYALPALLSVSFIKGYRISFILSVITILYSAFYCYMLSCFTFVSIEPLIAWFFIPFLFAGKSLQGFYFRMHMIRILFILFFASAAIWKIRGGGLFNTDQMSGILISQHAAILSSGEQTFFIGLLRFLIDHPVLSTTLYWIVAVGELFFFIGLFTKKYDRLLILILVCFLTFDYLLMQINYFSWLPFAGCFYFSRHTMPDRTNP